VKVAELASALGLKVLAGPAAGQREVSGGYASDLLSCVMARAKAGNVWVTLQAHANVVAVASLLDLAAVIVSEGVEPDEDTRAKAEAEGVTLLSSPKTTYAVVAEMARLGIPAGS